MTRSTSKGDVVLNENHIFNTIHRTWWFKSVTYIAKYEIEIGID